jgi:hypothetical protein
MSNQKNLELHKVDNKKQFRQCKVILDIPGQEPLKEAWSDSDIYCMNCGRQKIIIFLAGELDDDELATSGICIFCGVLYRRLATESINVYLKTDLNPVPKRYNNEIKQYILENMIDRFQKLKDYYSPKKIIVKGKKNVYSKRNNRKDKV